VKNEWINDNEILCGAHEDKQRGFVFMLRSEERAHACVSNTGSAAANLQVILFF
jgi:hypothetical protein